MQEKVGKRVEKSRSVAEMARVRVETREKEGYQNYLREKNVEVEVLKRKPKD